MEDSPCADCRKHTSTCHAECPDYEQWSENRKKERDARNKAKQKSNIVSEYTAESMRRVKRNSNKRKKVT